MMVDIDNRETTASAAGSVVKLAVAPSCSLQQAILLQARSECQILLLVQVLLSVGTRVMMVDIDNTETTASAAGSVVKLAVAPSCSSQQAILLQARSE